MLFPWQQQQWQKLWQAKEARHLPHALLFTGMSGIGKAQFAHYFSRKLLCQQPLAKTTLCECPSCRLVNAHTHPNVFRLQPEKAGQAIKVDQIRELNYFIQQSALQGEYKIAIIHPAQQMNINAANALLKTLEEPPLGSILILVSDQSKALPATILSRCQRMHFPKPNTEQALSWLKKEIKKSPIDHELLLKFAQGAPLAARQFLEEDIVTSRQAIFNDLCALQEAKQDPIQRAAKITSDPLQMIDLVLSFLLDLLRLQLATAEAVITNTDYAKQLDALRQSTQLKKNMQLLDYLQATRAQMSLGIHLNKQLIIENIYIRWVECR